MAEMQLTIDGREVKAQAGMTIFDACKKEGIPIPHLCFRKDLAPTAACRLCVVEVEGSRTLVASCAYPAANKMVVRTKAGAGCPKTGDRVLTLRPSL
jgi:NADH dehydrogenase/NADH:ubiquinone oxidoreductase subunit G